MAPRRIELVGGPFDGAVLHPSNPSAFLFTDGKRCYRIPGKNRVLYRNLSAGFHPPEGRTGVPFWFEGYRMTLCGSCGSFYVQSPQGCRLCGFTGAQV